VLAPGSRANTMLVTKALSQDVMVLAFVPLTLIPKESPNIHSNQLILLAYDFNKYHSYLLMMNQYITKQFIVTSHNYQNEKETLSCLKMPLFFYIY
jgi:hypothetical protein